MKQQNPLLEHLTCAKLIKCHVLWLGGWVWVIINRYRGTLGASDSKSSMIPLLRPTARTHGWSTTAGYYKLRHMVLSLMWQTGKFLDQFLHTQSSSETFWATRILFIPKPSLRLKCYSMVDFLPCYFAAGIPPHDFHSPFMPNSEFRGPPNPN